MKSSFPKRYKSILIVFMKITFFLPRPIHLVNIYDGVLVPHKKKKSKIARLKS